MCWCLLGPLADFDIYDCVVLAINQSGRGPWPPTSICPRPPGWFVMAGLQKFAAGKVKVAILDCQARVPELIPVLGSQPAGDVSHKPGGRLPLLSTRPAVTLATLKRAATICTAWRTEARWVWTVCRRTVTRQRRGCDLNPGSSAPESSTLTTRLPSQQCLQQTNRKPCLCVFVSASA